MFEFYVNDETAGLRLDVAASLLSGYTRSQIRRFMKKGLFTVNHLPGKPNYQTKTGDMICIRIPDEAQELVPERIPLEILYMDDYLVVVEKPPGLVVYPAAGHRSGTLLNAIAYNSRKLASVGGPLRPGVVHRLDKDTSGIMVVALDDIAYYSLVDQFKARSIKRRYRALVSGILKYDRGEMAQRIGRSESDRKKMSTKTRRGKEAVTTWRVIERFRGATLVEVQLATGRTHQIRVHFASAGYPVLGDKTYGKKTRLELGKHKIIFPRQMLHAELLGFIHPVTGEQMEFRSDLPDDMKECIVALRML